MVDKRRRTMWLTAGILSFFMSALWLTLLSVLVSNLDGACRGALTFLSSWTGIKTIEGASNFIYLLVIYSIMAITINLITGCIYLKISKFENRKFTLYKGRLDGILVLHFLFGGIFVPFFVAIASIVTVRTMRKHANAEIEKTLPFDIAKMSQQIQQVKRAYFVGDIATKDEYMRQINLILENHSK